MVNSDASGSGTLRLGRVNRINLWQDPYAAQLANTGASIRVSTSRVADGTFGMAWRVARSTANPGLDAGQAFRRMEPLEPSTTYTIAYSMDVGGVTVGTLPELHYYPGTLGDTGSTVIATAADLTAGGGYQRVVKTFTTSSTVPIGVIQNSPITAGITIYFDFGSAANDFVLFSGIIVRKGVWTGPEMDTFAGSDTDTALREYFFTSPSTSGGSLGLGMSIEMTDLEPYAGPIVSSDASGEGTLTASATSYEVIVAPGTGEGALGATAASRAFADAPAAGEGTLSALAESREPVYADAPAAGEGTLSATATSSEPVYASAPASGEGTLSAAALHRALADSAAGGSGTLSATATSRHVVEAPFGASGDLSVTGETLHPPVFTAPVRVVYPETRDKFFNRMPRLLGVTLLKEDGLYREVREPEAEEIDAADEVYLGGHDYVVVPEEAAALEAAGYSSNIYYTPPATF